MAGIFDLFRQIDDPVERASNMPDRGGTTIKPGLRLGAPGATPAKIFGSTASKPKGLSMRSYSDLNVNMTCSTSMPSVKNQKPTELLKPSVTQMDVDGRPISPRSKERFVKIKDLKPISMKNSSPKLKIRRSSPSLKLPQDNVFAIPSTPTVIKNNKLSSYPEPEKLAFYYDEVDNFLNPEEKPLETDFDELVATLTRSIQTYDDEGFESDPEILPNTSLAELKPYTISPPGNNFQEDSFALPEISDDEF